MLRIDFIGHGLSATLLAWMLYNFWGQFGQPISLERPPLSLQQVHLQSSDFKARSPRAQWTMGPKEHLHFEGPVELKFNSKNIQARSVEMTWNPEKIDIVEPTFINLNTPTYIHHVSLWPDKPNVEAVKICIKFSLPLASEGLRYLEMSQLQASESSLRVLSSMYQELLPQNPQNSPPKVGISQTSNELSFHTNSSSPSHDSKEFRLDADRAEFAKTAFFMRCIFEKIRFSAPDICILGPSGQLKVSPPRLIIDDAEIQIHNTQTHAEHAVIDLESGSIYADQTLVGHLLQ